MTTKEIVAAQNERAWTIRFEDTATAQTLSESALEIAKQNNNLLGIALAQRTLCFCFVSKGVYQKALEAGNRSISLLEQVGDDADLAQAVRNLNRVYWELGNYAKALECALRVLTLARQVGDQALEAHTYNNLAITYGRLGEYGQARKMGNAAIALSKKLDDLIGLVTSYNNFAMVSLSSGDNQEALHNAERGWELIRNSPMPRYQVGLLDTLGQVCRGLKRYVDALAHLRLAHHIAKSNGLKHEEAQALLNIGRIHLAQGEYEEAIEYGRDTLALAETIESESTLLESHELLADAYQSNAQYELALTHRNAQFSFYRTVFAEERDRNFARQAIRFRTEAAEREAALLLEKNGELELEIVERKRVECDLVQAKEAAELANKAKGRFIANMNHELRTPLNGILGYAQLLLRDGSLHKTQHAQIEVIKDCGSHLLTLINDILDMSKISANKVVLESTEVHLQSFLDNIVSLMAMHAQQQGLALVAEIDFNIPSIIRVDEKRLRQILINLLGNAVKFTLNGTVTLRVSCLSQAANNASLRFEVQDTGVGISAENQKKIFEPFEQVGSKQMQRKGTGLGLAITRDIVAVMGGQIQVRSELNVGSCFWFNIDVPALMPEKTLTTTSPSLLETLVQPETTVMRRLIKLLQMGDLFGISNELQQLTEPALLPFVTLAQQHIDNFDEEALEKLVGYRV